MNEPNNDRRPFILRTLDAVLVTILVFVGFAVPHRLLGDATFVPGLLHALREPHYQLNYFLPVFLIVLIPSLIFRRNRRAVLALSAVMALLLLVLLTPRGVE